MSLKPLVRALAVLSLVFVTLVQPVSADRNVPPGGSTPPDAVPGYPLVPRYPPAMVLVPQAATATDAVPDVIISDPVLDMKVLVILDSVDGAANTNRVMTDTLEALGVPYDLLDVNGRDTLVPMFAEADLWDGSNHGHYCAIFVSTDYVWTPQGRTTDALTSDEHDLIVAYERNFGVRQVTWNVSPWPPTDYGLLWDDTTVPTDTMTMTLTTLGQEVFNYLRPDVRLTITPTWHFLSDPYPPTGETTPLLQDANGHTILAIFKPGDGWEHMVMTSSMDHTVLPPSNIHAHVLPYGMVNWATKGVFLGERHFYFAAQPDDIFSWGDEWDPVSHSYEWGDHDAGTGYHMETERLRQPGRIDNQCNDDHPERCWLSHGAAFQRRRSRRSAGLKWQASFRHACREGCRDRVALHVAQPHLVSRRVRITRMR